MANANGFFSEEYRKLVNNWNYNYFQDFKAITDDENRIKFMYSRTNDMVIALKNSEKDLQRALNMKQIGNNHFQKKDNEKAISCYNDGIINCPQNTDDGRELLSVLIANRSAVLYDLNDYKKTVADIEYAEHIGCYPRHLQYKIWLRKAKCYDHIEGERQAAQDAYKKAIEYIKYAQLPENQLNTKMKELRECLKLTEKKMKNSLNTPVDNSTDFPRNKKYINAHCKVSFDSDEQQGRFAIANDNIDAGTIIVYEPAHCAVLASDFNQTNCQFCLISINNPIACLHCSHVVFCSQQCQHNAMNTFHKYECNIQPALFSYGASINCSMALRLITQRNLDYYIQFKNKWLNPGDTLEIPDVVPYDNSEYVHVYNLCRHQDRRKNEEFFHYTIMAIFLLRLLKNTDFFGAKTDQDNVTEVETYIGKLILRHLQQLQFNAHEIAELRLAPPGPMDPVDEPNFKTSYIGGGLYPTVALFNHSCDPSIVRYNISSKMIVQTIKPIKKGEIIYENYSPLYTSSPRNERLAFLEDRYWFTCNCIACQNDWPQFKNMDDQILNIACKTPKCKQVFRLDKQTAEPFLKCSKCGKELNILPILQSLMKLEQLLPQAEALYKNGKYNQATKMYLNAVTIYYRTMVPPFPDLVKIQQRLRTCFVHLGNKCIDYNIIKSK